MTRLPHFPRPLQFALLPLLLLPVALPGCDDAARPGPEEPPARALLVLNSLGATIDRIDLDTGGVEKGLAVVGAAPNDIEPDPESGSVYVSNSGDNDVWRLEASGLLREAVISLGPNSNPYDIELLAGGRIAVTCWLAGEVAFLDGAGGVVERRVPVGRTPQGLLHRYDRTLATVVNLDGTNWTYGTGEVVAIPDGAGAVAARQAVGINPQRILAGPDGRLHVLCTGNYGFNTPARWGEVHVLEPSTLAPADTIRLGGSPGAAVRVGDFIYVAGASGGLMKYDGETHRVLRDASHPILDRSDLWGMVADPERQRLYVTCFSEDRVYAIDTSADTLLNSWEVGDGPVALALVERR